MKVDFEKPLLPKGHGNPSVADMKDQCFVCMDDLKTNVSPSLSSSPLRGLSAYPLQHLSTYLKLDRATIMGAGPGPSTDTGGSEAAKCAVPLCAECSRVNEEFLWVLKQLRQIELEMANCLQRVHRRLVKSEEKGTNEVVRNSASVKETVLSSKKFVMDMRRKVIQECSRKVCELLANVHPVPEIRADSCRADTAVRRSQYQNQKEVESNIVIKTEPPNEIGDVSYQEFEPLSDNGDEDEDDSPSGMESDIINSEKKRQGATSSPQNKKRRIGRPPKVLKMKHSCQLCDKVFSRVGSLNVHHKKSHLGQRHHCPKCNKAFRSLDHLKIHKSKVNCTELIRRCHLCSEEFHSTRALRLHLKSVHSTALRDYICHLCGKEFYMPYLLDGHMKVVHLNIFENVCEHCGKTFTNLQQLRRHVKNIHLAERKTVFDCEACGKKFPRSCHLSRHQRKYHSQP